MSPSTAFKVPYVAPNPNNSWGPPLVVVGGIDASESTASDVMDDGLVAIAKFASLPYAPFGRSDRLGRAADFSGANGGPNDRNYGSQQVYSQQRYGDRNDRNNKGGKYGRYGNSDANNIELSANDNANDDNDAAFQLVDTTKTQATKRFVNPASKRRMHSMRLRQVNARRQGQGPSGGVVMDKMSVGRGGGRGALAGGGRGGPGGGRFGGPGGGRGGPGGRGYFANRQVDRQPSVSVQSDWNQVEEIALGKLTKNLVPAAVPAAQDVLWCGFLDSYNEAYDKVTTRSPVPLKRMENKEFYPVTTTDDPVLEKLAIDGAGQVFITDAILAHLMSCTRSVYPWDIVITKLPGGTLFFDKRDNSQFDYLTVQETSYTPPVDEEGGINSPERLGLEATMINQNFSQQILKSNKDNRKMMEMNNPFFDEDDAQGMEPASVAFRYRKFKLDENTTVVVRTELHATLKNGSQYMTAFALNEYTPSASNPNLAANTNPNNALLSWREKIDSQRGAVLATEFKNNSFKLAKWTAMSILADADMMKIGFISRANPKNNMEHVILATQFYRPKELAAQITLQESQMWSIFKTFVTMLQKPSAAEGKYVLMRDPNKPLLHLYKVPNHTFEDEE